MLLSDCRCEGRIGIYGIVDADRLDVELTLHLQQSCIDFQVYPGKHPGQEDSNGPGIVRKQDFLSVRPVEHRDAGSGDSGLGNAPRTSRKVLQVMHIHLFAQICSGPDVVSAADVSSEPQF